LREDEYFYKVTCEMRIFKLLSAGEKSGVLNIEMYLNEKFVGQIC